MRLTDERPGVLVIMDVTEDGTKELIAIHEGERESELSWICASRWRMLRWLCAAGGRSADESERASAHVDLPVILKSHRHPLGLDSVLDTRLPEPLGCDQRTF